MLENYFWRCWKIASVKITEYKENNSNLLLIVRKKNNIPNFFIKFWSPVLMWTILESKKKGKNQ